MKSIVFRIRKPYFDAIVNGQKIIEYRKHSPFWEKRLSSREQRIAVFICGKRVHRREIIKVEHIPTPSWFSEQGKSDVSTETCFAIHLGERIDHERDSKSR